MKLFISLPACLIAQYEPTDAPTAPPTEPPMDFFFEPTDGPTALPTDLPFSGRYFLHFSLESQNIQIHSPAHLILSKKTTH